MEDNSLKIYHRNLEKLVTDIFKVKNVLSPKLMNDVFEFIEKPYSLRTTPHYRSKRISTTNYGNKAPSPSSLGPNLFNLVPNKYKTIK